MMQRTRSILLSSTALVLFVTAGARPAHAAPEDFSVTVGAGSTVAPNPVSDPTVNAPWAVVANYVALPATATLSAGQSFHFTDVSVGLEMGSPQYTVPFGADPTYAHAATLALHFNAPAAAGDVTVEGTVTESITSGLATYSGDNQQHYRFIDVITASFISKTVTMADGTKFQIDVQGLGSQTITAWNLSIIGTPFVNYLILGGSSSLSLEVTVTLVQERTGDCSPGYWGPQCNACPSCGPYGTCNQGQNGDGTCLCDLFYSGTPCQPDLSACVTAYNSCQSAAGNCPATLTACQSDDALCNSSLATCQTASGTCQSSLTACQGDDATCQGSLGVCAAQTTALQSNLATCNAANATCATELADENSANVLCQASLFTAQTALADAQSALSQCSTQTTQLQTQLTACQASGSSDHTSLLTLQAQLATDMNAARDFFRLTFHDPTFVIPGATPADQLASLVAALGSLPPGQVNLLYRTLSARR
jgi:hypothetical protein